MRGRFTRTRQQGRHRSSVERRVQWLQQHTTLWNAHVDAHELVFAMKGAGLLAPSTYWKDVNIEALCTLAREAEPAPGETSVTVTVNGRSFAVLARTPLSYRDVVDLARVDGSPSVTLRGQGYSRTMPPGASLTPVEGLIFNVVHTDLA